jgi:hypothetical protein
MEARRLKQASRFELFEENKTQIVVVIFRLFQAAKQTSLMIFTI